MGGWWQTYVVEPGKLPLLLCALSFVVTFLTTRAITRMIRAGVGPFRDNVSEGGTHVHHAVYGVVLLVLGAVIAVGSAGPSAWRGVAAVLVGAGASLVLDEFALILHLEDVYWSREGRLSVQMISLTFVCLMFALIGVVPFGIRDPTEQSVGGALTVGLLLHSVLVLACAVKGKYPTALFGMFVPIVAWVGAFRLGRPGSLWARRRYHGAKLAKAERRASRFDARWDPLGDRLANLFAGSPTVPTPAVPAGSSRTGSAPGPPRDSVGPAPPAVTGRPRVPPDGGNIG